MSASQRIAIIAEEQGVFSFSLRSVSLKAIPPALNGESGNHVVYVSVLSELLAQQLAKKNEQYGLTQERIQMISLAAALHDIGKLQIPQSILDKAGALTPLEYDIVKKHSVLGEKIALSADDQTGIKGFKEIVCEITRHHHERYDGAGYPDALVGSQIPVSAQIVSIADTYDALTRERSYKQAISQDVALEMIANGMCGVFDAELVDCLAQVVGNKTLSDIRSSLLQSSSVYSEDAVFIPKKVLLLGNTKYITQDFLDRTFRGATVSIIGPSELSRSGKIKIYSQDPPNYKEILCTYDFDIILYFATDLTYDSLDPSDAEHLRQFLKKTKYIAKETKCIYLSSLDAAYQERNDRGVVAAAKESLCFYYAKEYDRDIKVIRIPYLYNAAHKGDYLYDLFEQMTQTSCIRIREYEDTKTFFLSMDDLSDLILRIADFWTNGSGTLTVNDEFNITFGELGREIARLKDGTQLEFTKKNPVKLLTSSNTALKKQYSWFSRISILADLDEEYAKYLAATAHRKGRWWEQMKAAMGKHFRLLKITELILMFLLSEVLVSITDSALFFSVVDFRMIYIVLLGTMHGLPYGLGAAGLSSFAWIIARIQSGTNWITLFYEPTNWLTFIFYFLVGAVCGYVKLVKEDKIRFLQEENELLEGRLGFTREIYEDTLHEKRDLKKQIIGSKDSFGKIFEITRQLNSVDARELYLKIINNFEDVLENKSISVYSVNEGSYFARLEVASRDIMSSVSRSISLDTYAPVMEAIKNGEVWRNTGLLPAMPMYCCGVFRDEKPLLLIFIWQAQAHQHSLYYVNLFRILCDLAQMSLLRAHDYSQAVYEKQYIPGTRIQNEAAFVSNLRSFRNLAERKVFQFQLLQVDARGYTTEQMNGRLQGCVRANDILGLTPDGNIRILLAQAGKEDLQYVLPRFEARGIPVAVLDPDSEDPS